MTSEYTVCEPLNELWGEQWNRKDTGDVRGLKLSMYDIMSTRCALGTVPVRHGEVLGIQRPHPDSLGKPQKWGWACENLVRKRELVSFGKSW